MNTMIITKPGNHTSSHSLLVNFAFLCFCIIFIAKSWDFYGTSHSHRYLFCFPYQVVRTELNRYCLWNRFYLLAHKIKKISLFVCWILIVGSQGRFLHFGSPKISAPLRIDLEDDIPGTFSGRMRAVLHQCFQLHAYLPWFFHPNSLLSFISLQGLCADKHRTDFSVFPNC